MVTDVVTDVFTLKAPAKASAWLLTLLAAVALLLGGCGAPPLAADPAPTAVTPAQPPAPEPPPTLEARFEQLSLDEGLSQSAVTAILQDSRGFLWFGTQDGLNRYDGYTFVVHRHVPGDPFSLSDNFIQALYEDPAGYLWVATHGGGLNRYDPRTERFTVYRHDAQDPASISHNNIAALHDDGAGRLWIGTASGVDVIDLSSLALRHLADETSADADGLSDAFVQAISQDREGAIWLGTFDDGLFRLNPQTGQRQVFRKGTADGGLPDDNIQAIFQDHAGQIWIGTLSGGLARYDAQTGRFIRFLHDPDDPHSIAADNVKAIFEDRWHNLWIGFTGAGLDRFDVRSGRFTHHQPLASDPQSLSNPTVLALNEDRSGILWVGTFGGGLDKYDPYARKFALYRHDPADPASLSSNMVWAFAETPDHAVWVATVDAGLNRRDPRTGAFTRYRHDPADPTSLAADDVWSLFVDHAGALWAGTGAGLDRFDPASGTFTHFETPPIFAMAEDDRGALWLATGGAGLWRLDPATQKITRFQHRPEDPTSLSADFLTSVLLDRSGDLWIGAYDGGLNKLADLDAPPETARFVRYQNDPADPASIAHDTVLDLYQDAGAALWVGTAGGLERMDPAAGTFAHFGIEQGLANELIYAVVADDLGDIWVSTNRGLSRLDPETGAVRNYTPRDGLQSIEFNQGAGLRASDGLLYFGGVNGFNTFDRAAVRERNFAPPVVVTGFELFNEPAPIGGDSPLQVAIDRASQVRLAYDQDFFSFEFAALDYAAPEQNRYAYMVEGLDKDWIYADSDRRYASYTNVPPGDYTLRVRGANSDGVWSDAEASLSLVITPPFWQTWWFQGAVVLALLGGLVAAYRLRVQSVEARSRELEAQVEQRTQEIELRQQELGALYRADEELYRHLHVDEVLGALTEIAVHILAADRSAVLTWDETRERPVVRASHGFSPQEVADLSAAGGAAVAEQVGRTGLPVIISDATTDPADLAAPGVRSSMHLPLKIQDEVFGVFCVGYATPHAFGADEQRLFTALAHRAATAVENARHFDEEHRRAEQLNLINEVGQRMNAVLAPDDLLQQLTAHIREAFGCSNVAIAFIEDGEVVAQAESSSARPVYAGTRAAIGQDGVWGWVAQNGEPLLVSGGRDAGSFVRATAEGPAFPSQLCVPLTAKDQTIGVLSIAGDQPNQFDEEDLIVLQALANQAATAIENARLYEQGQRIAVMEERGRLARDLHDAVTQTLFSVSLIAEALPAIWKSDRREGEELLEQMRKLSRGALAEMRTLLLELRPAALADAALPDLMRQLADAAAGRIGAPVEVTIDGTCQLPEQVRVTLYRIAQEALNNVAKHARASRAALKLSCRGAQVTLEIRDDGCGFDPEGIAPDHFGLGIIRERAEAIGARCEISSRPGAGAVVRVHWRGDPTHPQHHGS